MNAAFLLLSAACMTGQAPAKIAPAPAHGPHATVAPAACGPSCCDTACCDEGLGARLRGKLRGLFNRGDCCDTHCQPAPSCCDDHHGRRGHKLRGRFHRNDCCDSHDDCCDDGGLLGRLKGLFRKPDRCCDACVSHGCHGTVGGPGHPAPRVGEPIPAPKKMPKGGTSFEPNREVRIITPPSGNPIPAQTPALETVPAIVPSINGDNRNPF